ncbi:tetratricopeptide repeat protein [Treponema sp. OttesenSCG-928-L16]|nr:tetratricopeptide repeat protein [Treponema sp. OttesenSCG-928-L16]
MIRTRRFFQCVVFLSIPFLFFEACTSQKAAVSAEEYYSLGMAYFELGKYEEAEHWLNRARRVDKTKRASEYNLGRIAFETGRYEQAASIFERILKDDPENVMVLQAAAYSRIKTGEFEKAESLYDRLLLLVPESADDGYNHALVLFAIDKAEQAEEVLLRYSYSLDENKDTLLLLARTQKAQGKVEALDNYAKWLQSNTDISVQAEYAQVLENAEFYARAIEVYAEILKGTVPENSGLNKADLRFDYARLLLIADEESEAGMNELRTAAAEGFSDTEKARLLLEDERIKADRAEEIRRILSNAEEAEIKEADMPEADPEGNPPPDSPEALIPPEI